MPIDIEKIKILRKKTQAGIMDCQKALINAKGDINQSIIFLRKQGIVKASDIQKQNISFKGLTHIIIDNNQAVLYEINSETDFVAKNQDFMNLVILLGKILLQKAENNMNIDEILNLDYQQKKIRDLLLEKTAIFQEKISLSRFIKVIKNSDEHFGFYKHQNGFISVLVILKIVNNDISEDIAMHIAANNPQFLNKEQINLEILDKEKAVINEQINKELGFSKSSQIKKQIMEGRLNKFINSICLLEQSFVKNPDQKVKDYLKVNNAQVINYWYLKVGERTNSKN